MLGKNIKIFIIDESPVYRDIFIKALSEIPGIEVIGKTLNEEIALKKLKTLNPDQIIIDVDMKNFSAARFTRSMISKNPKIGILLTCKKDPTTAEKTLLALENGAYDFIIKPKTNSEKEIIDILKQRMPTKIRNFSTQQYSSSIKKELLKKSSNLLIYKKQLATELTKELPLPSPPSSLPQSQKSTFLRPKGALPAKGRFEIVVIGASTGGPDALTKFIPYIPKHFSLPIVIAIHMPKLFTASLASILNKRSSLNVTELSDTEIDLLPGNVYIGRGGRNISIRRHANTVYISSKKDSMKSLYMPCIDLFFEKAASIFKNSVLSIILTGMGNDGVRGMKTLQTHGGFTIAQDEATSVVWGMPGEAVKSGCINEICPITTMADRLLALTGLHSNYEFQKPIELTKNEFDDLSKLILEIWGISIAPEKSYLFTTRLESLLKDEGYSSFQEFHTQLKLTKDKSLEKKLIELMTTNETSFFRDKHPYENLEKNILPMLASKKKTSFPKKIKIWSAGCSKGQEPYSIAIKIAQWVKTQNEFTLKDFSIYASDISDRVLRFARERTYPASDVEKDIPRKILIEYFDKFDNFYKVNPDIYKMITFNELNLSLPFEHLGKFDLIFCRNVMIYFSQTLKEKILEQFYNLLKPDGILIIGASESLYKATNKFICVQKNNTSYYKVSNEKI